MYVLFCLQKIRIFFRNSRFLCGVFLGVRAGKPPWAVEGRFFCRVWHPRCYWRRCAQGLYHPRQHLPRFACAPIGRRFGIPLLSFPPPSGNPGWPYAGYYAAANRLAGIHPRQHPPGCRIKCGMTAQTRRLCYPRGCCRGLPSRETLHATSLQCPRLRRCTVIAAIAAGDKKTGSVVVCSPSWLWPVVRV